jgi:dolichol-phosphate mannosyltransferase
MYEEHMKIIVVIPTYNEAQNIEKLIPILADEFREIKNHDMYILVVDGNSPDGTGDVVLDYSGKYPFVSLLLEEKKSTISAAYLYAFNHAIKNMDAEVIIEMDADFQHDPKKVKELVAKIDEGYDCVIASRYIKGGSIPGEWAFYRKFLSYGGNIFTKIMLWMFDVNDFTSGFRATRVRGFFDKIDLTKVSKSSFAYKMDLIYQLNKQGAKFAEIPLQFGLRDRGNSKMERSNFMDSLKVVTAIRMKESASFFKFLAVGFVGLFTDLTLSNILRFTPLLPNVAAVTAGIIAMAVTFTLNNFWSFKDRKFITFLDIISQYVRYALVSVVPLAVRWILVEQAVAEFGNTLFVYNGALFVAIVFGTIWNYIFYSRVIWKRV